MRIKTLSEINYGHPVVLPVGIYTIVDNWPTNFVVKHCDRRLAVLKEAARIIPPLEELAKAAE